MRRWTLSAACLSLALIGPAAGRQLRAPIPLTEAVTLRCSPPLVTATDDLIPRKYLVVRSQMSSALGGVLIWTNNESHYSFVGPNSFWWNTGVCTKSALPESLPRASMVRIADPDLTCVVPGRRLLIHAARNSGSNAVAIRAMPHGQLLFRVELRGPTVRSYASRYAVRLCDLSE